MPRVQGITKQTLWAAWKNIRKQLSRAMSRDVTDFFEYDIDPDWWIKQLLSEVDSGRYEPSRAYRFSVAKKMGFSRRMTQPSVPDLVLYRAAVDHIYLKAKAKEKEHVYFAQNTLSKKIQQIKKELAENEPGYSYLSGNAFVQWLKYDQYRKLLLIKRIHPFIVTTDITNFFDTILYDRVADSLHGIRVDRDLVGLLFFILERLSIRDAFNESPRIGLPVDEFDCSRTLAHLVLFPHDDRMARLVGQNRYIRWMDDQNFGADTYAEGLMILKECGESLARLHLTPNAAKSRILSLKEASIHFHFNANAALDKLEEMPRSSPKEQRAFRTALAKAWQTHQKAEKNGGEWGKVLKRFYRLAGMVKAKFLRHRASRDILTEPTLTERVVDYMRVTSSAGQYLSFAQGLWSHPEQVYPDVNQLLTEGLLKVDANPTESREIRKVAVDLLSNKYNSPGWQRCATIAPLLILRFGDNRSKPLIKRLVNNSDQIKHPAILKALVAVFVAYGTKEFQEAKHVASRLQDNHLALFIRQIDELTRLRQVPDRFKIRRQPINDTVSGHKRVDVRKLLVLRLLRLNNHATVQKWLRETHAWMCSQDIPACDKSLVNRLLLS